MKRLIGLTVCLGLALALSGCGKSGPAKSNPSPAPSSAPTPAPPSPSPAPSSDSSDDAGAGTAQAKAKAEAKPKVDVFDDHSDDPWYDGDMGASPGGDAISQAMSLFGIKSPAGSAPSGGAASPPGTAAKSDRLAAVGKNLVGVWTGKPTRQEDKKKAGHTTVLPRTVEFKDGGAMSFNEGFVRLNGTWEVLTAEGNNVAIRTAMEIPDLSFAMEKGKARPLVKTKKTPRISQSSS